MGRGKRLQKADRSFLVPVVVAAAAVVGVGGYVNDKGAGTESVPPEWLDSPDQTVRLRVRLRNVTVVVRSMDSSRICVANQRPRR